MALGHSLDLVFGELVHLAFLKYPALVFLFALDFPTWSCFAYNDILISSEGIAPEDVAFLCSTAPSKSPRVFIPRLFRNTSCRASPGWIKVDDLVGIFSRPIGW